jgi:hypothetical protein
VIARQDTGPATATETVVEPPSLGDPGGTAALEVLPADQFGVLIRMGKARGGLTQDDVMTVLRSVELSADLITEVVARIREAGIEFTYDTGETTVVPMTGAVADDLSGRLLKGMPGLSDEGRAPVPADEVAPSRILGLEPAGAAVRNGAVPVAVGEVADVAGSRTPVKKERAPRKSASKDAYSDGEGFRGSAADPVHMYLKEIGKVKLLDAALEVELAERIVAGNEAAERLAAFEGGTGESYPNRAGDRVAGPSRSGGQGGAHRGQPPPGGLDRQAVPQPGPGLPRPDPGGQPRPHAGRREVRPHQGLQVLHLRHVVDPPGDHPGHRRPGPDHPDPGPHGRDHQQGGLGPASAPPGARARAERIEEVAGRVDFPIERVREIQRINQDTVSLEQPVGDEDDFSLSDLIEDREAVVPDDAAARTMLDDAVREALGHSLPVSRMWSGSASVSRTARSAPSKRWARRSGSPASGSARSRRRRWPSCVAPSRPSSCGTTSKKRETGRGSSHRVSARSVECRRPLREVAVGR